MKWNEEMLSIYRLKDSTIPPNPRTIPPNPCKYVNGIHLANLTNLPNFHFFFNCLVALWNFATCMTFQQLKQNPEADFLSNFCQILSHLTGSKNHENQSKHGIKCDSQILKS